MKTLRNTGLKAFQLKDARDARKWVALAAIPAIRRRPRCWSPSGGLAKKLQVHQPMAEFRVARRRMGCPANW